MSPLRRHALRVADAELRRRRGLQHLSREERHGVEALAASVALRVTEVLESAAATEPALARALHELEGPLMTREAALQAPGRRAAAGGAVPLAREQASAREVRPGGAAGQT